MNNNWHSLKKEQIFDKLSSDKKGLSTKEVEQRQHQYGKNILPKSKELNWVQIFMAQFKSALIIILIISGIISALIGEYVESIFILIIIIVNAILGAYQENSAVKSASNIQKLIKIKTKILRNGKQYEIDAEELVPGDIVFLESGDKVPADIRILKAHNLQLDESFLTGESIGIMKNASVISGSAEVPSRTNMCYASSTVLSGRATGIVTTTGINTEIGHIAENLTETKESKTPLTIRMEKFTKQIMYIIFIFSIITYILMLTKGYENREIFLLIVAMCVSAIPESLPIAQTVVLSVATSSMSKKNVIVKKLSSVESLGSCTVIASDKTGTLTVNQQTAKIITLPDGTNYSITGEGYNDKGHINLKDANKKQNMQIGQLCQMGMLNNEAFLEKKNGEFTYHGDSIDLAFLALAFKNKIVESDLKKEMNVLGVIPYESEEKFSAVFFKDKKDSYITVKGSCEKVLEFCDSQIIDGKEVPIDEKNIKNELLRLSAEGFRVIAVASGKSDFKEKSNYDSNDIKKLTFMGFVGFVDPIRNTSKSAIKQCHGAGIRVIMITGDHPLTAKHIAKELNLSSDEDQAIAGHDIEEAFYNSKSELIRLVTNHNVFARVSPVQKSIIVETLKEQGEFIAVTGDGINDAPALKKANIGVAMGSGTDVAKDVSSMIITDDNFLSVVSAVEEGRHAYNNIRKVTYLLISTAFAEMMLFIISIIFNLPPPFTTVQILWINLVTNGIQDIAIAMEKGEKGVMRDSPRAANEKLFNSLLIKETILSAITMFLMVFAVWYILNTRTAMPLMQARNYILLLMVLLQNVHAFNCRSEKVSVFKVPLKNNKFIVYAVAAALILHIAFMNIPFLQGILKTNSVTFGEFGTVLLLALPLLIVMEIFKLINKKKQLI